MRQLVLDTETTGLETSQGHRIIEIGCVELINRRLTGNHYHQYIQPEREIDQAALEVHGISQEFLADKPVFADIAQEFVDYVDGAELIIHNAPFDIGFINYELSLLDGFDPITNTSSVIDSLVLARHKHPGQSNKLDALCKRYFIDNGHRTLHGALLDSEILADVYLAMTGGQVNLMLDEESGGGLGQQKLEIKRLAADRQPTPVIYASESELASHQAFMEKIQAK